VITEYIANQEQDEAFWVDGLVRLPAAAGLLGVGLWAEWGLQRVTTATAFRLWFLLGDHGPEHP